MARFPNGWKATLSALAILVPPAASTMVDLHAAILARLDKLTPPDKEGWVTALCPFHADRRRPNLRVSTSGFVCMACDEKGSLRVLAEKLGIPEHVPFEDRVAQVYNYRGADGRLIYQSVRLMDPKEFRLRRPSGADFVWNMNGVMRVPYRLPELLAADPDAWVVVPEGEKDADRARAEGFVATTNAEGAGKWRDEFSKLLAKRRVAVLSDNDEPGRRHAVKVATSLLPHAQDVRLVEFSDLPNGGDVSDWFENGGTAEELQRLIEATPPFTAEADEASANDDDQTVDEATPRGRDKLSQADLLVEVGSRATLFHDTRGQAYAAIEVDGHREIWSVPSKRFKNWLRREFHREQRKVPGSDAVNAAIGVLEGIAQFDGAEHELHNRVAWCDGAIYYDLADAQWRAVRIDTAGWTVVDHPPILFRRHAHQRPQVIPAPGGDIQDVFRFVNVRDEDCLLLCAWLVSSLVPNIPHPIADFNGQKGSGKSSGQKVFGRLIDPSETELLSFPSSKEELIQQLDHHYSPVYDNLDQLSPALSDMLCRAVTGEGASKRQLYTDEDDIIFRYRRVILINGINRVPQRPDLLDRALPITLERIPRGLRREEEEFWSDFERARPMILGALFSALSMAMRIRPTLQLYELERMADFTRWGAAVAVAMGLPAAAFLAAYSGTVAEQTKEAVRAHIVGSTVIELMVDRESWAGSPSDLLVALEDAGVRARLLRRSSNGKIETSGWPGAPHILSRRLNEVRSNLAELGLVIEEGRDDKRWLSIRRIVPQGPRNSVGSVGSDDLASDTPGYADATDATDAISDTSEESMWEKVFR